MRLVVATMWLGLAATLGSASACGGGSSPSEPGGVPPGGIAPMPASVYVSPQGDDDASGDTPDDAVRTIQRALQLVEPGETVRVLPGTYAESIRTRLQGRPDATIAVVGEGGRPVLTGERSSQYGLWLEASEHVRLEGLEVRDYSDMGLVIVASREIVLRDLDVHHNGFRARIRWVEGYGMHLDESAGLTVESNRVYHNGPDPRGPREAGTGINAYAIRSSVIRDNQSYDNLGGGILVEDSVDVLVERNDVYRNDLDVSADGWWDGGIWLDGGRDVTVRDNTFRDNLGPGIEVSDEDCQSPTGYVLENNRSFGNYFGIYVWNFGTTDLPPPHVLRLSGNDFSGNSRRDIWIEARLLDC